MRTVGDLQGGIEEAEHILGYKVVPVTESRDRRLLGGEWLEVPILKQGEILIASIQSALADADLRQLRDALVERVADYGHVA